MARDMLRGAGASFLQGSLTPPPSISQTGRRAYEMMHTEALVKAGVSSFNVPKKINNSVINHNEVVDPSQLDSFGSVPAGVDEGRNREMVSSPRDHPLILARQEHLEKVSKATAFERTLRELNTLRTTGATEGSMLPISVLAEDSPSPVSEVSSRNLNSSARPTDPRGGPKSLAPEAGNGGGSKAGDSSPSVPSTSPRPSPSPGKRRPKPIFCGRTLPPPWQPPPSFACSASVKG
eukprot:RCo053541